MRPEASPKPAAMKGGSKEAAWLRELGAAAAGIGAPELPGRLLHLLGALIPHDMALVCRYVDGAPPDFLVCEGMAPHLVELYRAGLWRYDPFYAFWRAHREGGVASLRQILPPAERAGYYRRVFQRRQAKIDDELGLFLPGEAAGSLGLFLERSRGAFSAAERRLAEAVAPALSGLYLAHRRVAGKAVADGAPQRSRNPEAVGALARSAVETSGTALTRREKEIVALILEGHPSAGIAERLGISRGTVKNHRRRIHRKLDITSERELFVTFLGRPKPG